MPSTTIVEKTFLSILLVERNRSFPVERSAAKPIDAVDLVMKDCMEGMGITPAQREKLLHIVSQDTTWEQVEERFNELVDKRNQLYNRAYDIEVAQNLKKRMAREKGKDSSERSR